jgi:hypothetical protein
LYAFLYRRARARSHEEEDDRLLAKVRDEAIYWIPFDYADTPDVLATYEDGDELFDDEPDDEDEQGVSSPLA